jgi:hypothetical protein
MDDTPAHFLDEFKNTILKEKIGIIAMAIILARRSCGSRTPFRSTW